MKKTYKSSLLALSVLASFTSCSESESLQQANLSKDKITFHATLDNSWKPLSPASSSRAAIAAAAEKGPIVVPTPFGKPLYLHPVVQETADLQQAAATTRGAMQEGTNLDNTYYNNSFGVTAISNSNGTNTALFTNQKASKNNEDIWEIDDKTNSRWPFDALVSFHAYAPFNNATDGMWSVTTDADNVKTKISYTAKADAITSQPDLIVATNAESRSYTSEDKAVELNFSHALTAVNFAISQDLTEIFHTGATDGSKLKSITLSGIPNEGTCELAAKEGSPKTALQNWTLATDANGKKTGSYTFNLENKNITIGESYALTSNKDKNILMMIPQKLNGTKAQLTFVLDIKGKGDQTFTFDLSNQTWLPGTSVTYKLSASAINHLENTEVKFPDSWKDTEQVKYSYPKTDFAAGESIGLYVVNSKNKIEEANLKLTRDKDGKWMPANADTKFLKLKNYKYFAYYPYNAAALNVDATKDHAEEFFKDKISSLSVVSDQSKEATLLAQDFQVAKGEIANDGSTLDFNMEHQVGLAVLNLKEKGIAKYRQFTDNSYMYYYGTGSTAPTNFRSIGTETLRASNNFAGNKPYIVPSENKCLQIIPFNQELSFKAKDQDSSPRTAWGYDKEYSVTPKSSSPVVTDITVDAEYYKLARLFEYKESTESFTVPVDGTYTLECWGAGESQGGKSQGDYQAPKNQVLYICVGGKGSEGDRAQIGIGGYNSGGNGGSAVVNDKGQPLKRGDGGSGATHICLVDGVLSNLKTAYEQNRLLMVAGGQGGAQYKPTCPGLFGGGTEGGKPTNAAGKTFDAATQRNGFAFGQGQTGRDGTIKTQNGGEGNGGGGGGLYGGYSPQAQGNKTNSPGGGGSGYVNKKLLVNSETIAGSQSFLSPSGVSETGHAGNGAALITWLP